MGTCGRKRDGTGHKLRAVGILCHENNDGRGCTALLRPVKGGPAAPLRELDVTGTRSKDDMVLPEAVDHHVQVPDLHGFYGAGRDHDTLPVIPRAVATGRGIAVAGNDMIRKTVPCSPPAQFLDPRPDILRIRGGLPDVADMDPVKIGIELDRQPVYERCREELEAVPC